MVEELAGLEPPRSAAHPESMARAAGVDRRAAPRRGARGRRSTHTRSEGATYRNVARADRNGRARAHRGRRALRRLRRSPRRRRQRVRRGGAPRGRASSSRSGRSRRTSSSSRTRSRRCRTTGPTRWAACATRARSGRRACASARCSRSRCSATTTTRREPGVREPGAARALRGPRQLRRRGRPRGGGRAPRRDRAGDARGERPPVALLAAPRGTPGIDRSDHRSFWKEGFPALLVTDTAYLRNPHYHQASDLPGTLDYARLVKAARAAAAAIEALAGPSAP